MSGKKGLVLWFFPMAGSPRDTLEGQQFAACCKEYAQIGYNIAGVSTDSVGDLAKFHEENKFPYPLLCDDSQDLVDEFGSRFCLLPWVAGRATFVLDADGFVVKRIGDFDIEEGPKKLVKELASLHLPPREANTVRFLSIGPRTTQMDGE
mmetsp:Transcript_93592/g.165602  ORF Transcript_93592/g.165602 Transcript_93592/m.165602 type:complete len:150 (-) Transcript_93592:130-579(-)